MREGEFAAADIKVGAIAFAVCLPLEFGEPRRDLVGNARSVLAQIVDMDDAVRAQGCGDGAELAYVLIREFFVELHYYATEVNSEWSRYFTLVSGGAWRLRGFALPWMSTWLVKEKAANLALDAAYGDASVGVAGVYFADWGSAAPLAEFSKRMELAPHAYEPGAFYKRELPPLMALLDEAPLPVATIVVDSYVWLSGDGRPGLGARLYEALARRAPVIGVAKTKFHNDTWSRPVRRGASEIPLYVTGAGIDRADAARRISRMSGPGRIPALLKRADDLARKVLR